MPEEDRKDYDEEEEPEVRITESEVTLGDEDPEEDLRQEENTVGEPSYPDVRITVSEVNLRDEDPEEDLQQEEVTRGEPIYHGESNYQSQGNNNLFEENQVRIGYYLSFKEKKELYPKLLLCLDKLEDGYFNSDEIYTHIQNQYSQIANITDKVRERFLILTMLYFARFKANNMVELFNCINSKSDLNHDTIGDIILKVERELWNTTGKYLYSIFDKRSEEQEVHEVYIYYGDEEEEQEAGKKDDSNDKDNKVVKSAIDDDYKINVKKQEVKEDYKEELKNTNNHITPDKMQSLVSNEMETPNINIPNFREIVMEQINKISDSIECTIEQRKIILSESEKILDRLISRAENNEFTIAKNTNLEAIAASIIYTVSISCKDIPKITATQLAKQIKGTYASITNFYKRYFESLYPEVRSLFDEALMWVFFEKISSSLGLHHELELYEIAKNLYEQAKKNSFDPDDLDLAKPKYIAAALIILSTHLSKDHKYITPQNLMENFRKDKELKIYGIQHRVITEVINEIIRHTQNLFSTLPPFLSIEDFEPNIIRILDVFIENFKFKSSSLLKNFAVNVFNNAKLNGFPYNTLTQYLHGSFRPSNVSFTLIFYALKHIDYPDSRFKDKKYGTVQFEREYFPNDSTMQTRIAQLIPFIYKYLSEELKKKILYAPLYTSKGFQSFDETQIWFFFEKISSSLNLQPIAKLNEIAKNLYEQAKENNFDPDKLNSKNPRHIAAALIVLSTHLSKEHEYFNPYNLIKKIKESKELSKYGLSEHSLASTIKEILKYVRSVIPRLPDVTITSEGFIDDLIRIRNNYKDKDYISYLFCDLILHLYNLSGFKKPSHFLSKLNIYYAKPSEFIRLLGEKQKLLISKKLIEEAFTNIENFIQNYIPDQYQESTTKLYYDLRDNINARKSDIERDRDERIRKRKEKYSRFYKSTHIRIKNFIKCSGFSPYDGYDLWENKIIDPETEKIRIWGQFHHLHYNPIDESDKDLVFLPLKHPNDRGKGKAPYLTHSQISGHEAIVKRHDTSQDVKRESIIKLNEIENRVNDNTQILLRLFFTRDLNLINDLIGWSNKPWYAKSVSALTSRVKDNSFKWCNKINDYIPKFKGEYLVSNRELQKIFQELSDSRLS